MKHNVYLAQVNNQFGNNVFLPYSVGLIQAYCQTIAPIADNFDFQGFIYLRGDPDAAARRMERPAVAGISCYVWNWEWSKALAQGIKKHHPGCLVVLGGPQVPIRSHAFFQEHPYVDLLVHYEGEIAFSEVLLEHLKEAPDYTRLLGVSVKADKSRCLQTPTRERIANLEQLPSPYLAGVFDPLLREPFDFHASQETHRGCPYSCTFCDWGSAVFTKVRAFSDQRLERELEWFGKNKIELLYNCDANYGLLKRDYALTAKLVETKRTFGFPVQFRAAFAKNSDAKIFQLAKVLNDADMSKGVTLSFQSLNKNTLNAVKRSNIKIGAFQELIGSYRKAGIPTYTELIIGLPGETYDSFAEGIEELLRAGQHGGMNIYLCSLLPNSEMSDPSYVAEHGIKTVRMPILHQHSSPPEDGITEYNDIVVETNHMSRQDFKRIFLFCWSVQSLHTLGLTQHLAHFLLLGFGLPYRAFYESLLAFAEANPRTLLGEQLSTVSGTVDGAMEGKGWGMFKAQFGNVLWPNEEATFLDLVCQKSAFYQEMSNFLAHLAAAKGLDLAEDLVEDLLTYQQHSVTGPSTPRRLSFDLRYNLHEYFQGIGQREQIPLTRKPCRVTATSEVVFGSDLERYARQVVWYGRKDGKLRQTKLESNASPGFRQPAGSLSNP